MHQQRQRVHMQAQRHRNSPRQNDRHHGQMCAALDVSRRPTMNDGISCRRARSRVRLDLVRTGHSFREG